MIGALIAFAVLGYFVNRCVYGNNSVSACKM
jgi:hypothetical protein